MNVYHVLQINTEILQQIIVHVKMVIMIMIQNVLNVFTLVKIVFLILNAQPAKQWIIELIIQLVNVKMVSMMIYHNANNVCILAKTVIPLQNV